MVDCTHYKVQLIYFLLRDCYGEVQLSCERSNNWINKEDLSTCIIVRCANYYDFSFAFSFLLSMF